MAFAGNEAIDFANSQVADVVITDHREMPPVLPDAYCIVHPGDIQMGIYPFESWPVQALPLN